MPAGDPRTNGALLLDQIQILEDLVGTGVVRRALDTLSDAERTELRATTAVSWVPVDLDEKVFRLVAGETGREHLPLLRQVADLSIERTFRTIWRLLLRFTSDSAIVSRGPTIYRKAFDVGTWEPAIPQPGRAEISLRGWPAISDHHLYGLLYGTEAVFRVAGRRNVTGSLARTPDGASFVASWDP